MPFFGSPGSIPSKNFSQSVTTSPNKPPPFILPSEKEPSVRFENESTKQLAEMLPDPQFNQPDAILKQMEMDKEFALEN